MNEKLVQGLKLMEKGMYLINLATSSFKEVDRYLLDIMNGDSEHYDVNYQTQNNYFFKHSFDEEYNGFFNYLEELELDATIKEKENERANQEFAYSLNESNTRNCIEGLNNLVDGIAIIVKECELDSSNKDFLLSITNVYNPFKEYGFSDFLSNIKSFVSAYLDEIEYISNAKIIRSKVLSETSMIDTGEYKVDINKIEFAKSSGFVLGIYDTNGKDIANVFLSRKELEKMKDKIDLLLSDK